MVEKFNPPTRNQIARIANGDARLIKAFEQIFKVAGTDVFLLSERVTAVEIDVAANASAIASNTADISANAASIATNIANILANAASILANEPRIGAGQSWQDVSGSRADSTSYQNGTDRPIQVNISGNTTERPFEVSTDDATWVSVGNVGGALEKSASVIIPSGHYYRVNGTTTITVWAELR